MNKDVFEAFNIGNLSIPGKIIKFDQIEWSKHPTFEGVELKHIITGKQTEGQFSYHLVRIAPGKAIKNHIHETQLETHEVVFIAQKITWLRYNIAHTGNNQLFAVKCMECFFDLVKSV